MEIGGAPSRSTCAVKSSSNLEVERLSCRTDLPECVGSSDERSGDEIEGGKRVDADEGRGSGSPNSLNSKASVL